MNHDSKITPIMQQYMMLKSQYKEYLLFYRLGDFYELFFDDAIETSRILNIVLTKKGNVPMCGVPFHSSESYLNRLVKLGYKIAICEQLETSEEAKKRGYKALVKRDVVRIVTPGTILEDSLLEAKENNYLSCIVNVDHNYAIAWLELSTGLFYYHTTELHKLDSDLFRINPKEVLISDKLVELDSIYSILRKYKFSVTQYSGSFFDVSRSYNTLCNVYGISTLKGLGDLKNEEIAVCGSLLEYVKATQKGNLPQLEFPKAYSKGDFMFIDAAALRNLELFCTQSGDLEGSLISSIDYTITACGGRLLKRCLSAPLACSHAINRRLDIVEFFVNDRTLCRGVRETLRGIADIERILTRIKVGKCSPKDLYALKLTLDKIFVLLDLLHKFDSSVVGDFCSRLGKYDDLCKTLDDVLIPNNVNNVKDGGFINPDYDAQLSEYIYIQSYSNDLIQELRDKYRNITNIQSLKILYNNILGYYVEVSSSYLISDKDFIHRQTLANSIRYTTSELKALESKIISARDAAINLEVKIFGQLCTCIIEVADKITMTAHAIAEIDMLTSFAELAIQYSYTKPIVDDSYEFNIKKGRHPVVERNGKFVANDIDLSLMQRVHLITGPNMAGKSTFLRQNALIGILAHIGSFVPAQHAHIGVIDKVFSRVGASDNIASGHSTFMVEMTETAAIINQATDKSFVILDEIGRGTGTYDGLSIAWSVIEQIHNVNKSRAIFATHYHELSKLDRYLENIKCFCMKVEEWNGKVVFLHEIIPGSTNKSYGIHVAKLAGFPQSVLDRAEDLMSKLKANEDLLT
ncbi:DNA mismatch repair protein MutS [Ehrlichia chaffeensis str. Liberty]|uniref:DNA mismatch repair protein MutS n=1 Tax=Ehrlichia chaffeensis (strain ATCC CRL-10679 / Arkansas) TaxID=205920 RepID=MUTS_EHRCR|nr:DNA mismatch repair protein MutS [Ehrlichia chaffeensis]Q2GG13.1 RecName: Full=DNA mismatch repair protein MutS [Ehrlichia chaffeensis str. Arkansas]ABD45507.1 DNA mismatch repair protein MutS [Ehrlichia chaffeensis str. Arkansas]AHX06384.1 DNA mismatch repair protein MutS [Ehrlichia chaffeensis str. Liberty]